MGNDKRKERRRRRKGKKEGIMERLRIGWPDLHIWGRIGETVYKLIHSTTGELYALKIINNPSMSIPVPASLDHPNVVKIHDILKNDDGGQIQVLMEYMDGGSLQGFHTLRESALAFIAYRILSGLSHLHSKNLFHAAIKPSNILVASPMQVKMADFGLSIACTSPDTTATYAADIWSLGVCLVQFYLGTSSFDQHDLPKLPPTASREFNEFMAHCLDRDPANRWAADQLLRHDFIHYHTAAAYKLRAQPSPPKQNQIFEIALQLYAEDCPDRWPKVASIITDRKTANDILRYSKMYAISYFEWSKLIQDRSTETPKSRSSKIIKTHPLGVSVQEYHHQEEQITETPPTWGGNEGVETKCYIKDVQAQNLPDCLGMCVVYCLMFSNDYEFEMDKLVRLWIAMGLIKPQKTLEMEDIGRFYFDILVCKEFILRSTYDYLRDQFKYKVNQSMVPSFQIITSLLPRDCKKGDAVVSGDTSNSVTHLSLLCEDVTAATFKIIGDYHCLQTLMVVHSIVSPKLQISNQLFLSLKLLRVLDLSRSYLTELPGSIEYLISLRYLDLSQTHITKLPFQVEFLQELQTLNLYDCNSLDSLPKGMQKLVNLRHLDLNILKLRSMPSRMGNLTSLQTLRGFIVGEEDGCGLSELKNLNKLRGLLRIHGLENVSNPAEAREAYLSNKHDLNSLELRWGNTTRIQDGKSVEVLEYLRPPSHIKELTLLSYRGSVLPSWISNPAFVDIVSITLHACVNCHLLPSIGELPSLKFLKLYEMNKVRIINRLFCRNQESEGYHAFPKLEKLTVDIMDNLEEWTGVESGDFPCLRELSLQNCPKIVALPFISHLNSLKHLEIGSCETLQSSTEEGLLLPASLEFLYLSSCKKIVALPSLSHLKSLRDLALINCLNLQSFPVEGLPVSLQALTVIGCPRIQQCQIAKVNCISDSLKMRKWIKRL